MCLHHAGASGVYRLHVLESDLGLQVHMAWERQILKAFLHVRVILILLHNDDEVVDFFVYLGSYINADAGRVCINVRTKKSTTSSSWMRTEQLPLMDGLCRRRKLVCWLQSCSYSSKQAVMTPHAIFQEQRPRFCSITCWLEMIHC